MQSPANIFQRSAQLFQGIWLKIDIAKSNLPLFDKGHKFPLLAVNPRIANRAARIIPNSELRDRSHLRNLHFGECKLHSSSLDG